MLRRTFLSAVPAALAAAPAKETFTYKKVNGLEIQADVYRAGTPAIF